MVQPLICLDGAKLQSGQLWNAWAAAKQLGASK